MMDNMLLLKGEVLFYNLSSYSLTMRALDIRKPVPGLKEGKITVP